ncbi:arsenic transporter [Pseudomonas sp. Leaf129]|uniref:arsenic transporter n=1 Tax=Pseudomonas sp. Leaf129 TaxID=1736268 RepID=UPI000703111D|nr:arsenic transporter [Pseudomonas sp. Leaf129]KQQ63759.1 arsenic transporter [Pseudomonas sp. Leaf129]
MPHASLIIWGVSLFATLGIITRPLQIPEYVWALAAAIGLVAGGLIAWSAALAAVLKGADVYLFLVGMMLLAELARREGLFDWLATVAARQARGSAQRLFDLVFAVGTLVTIFLSNDATAVVLTPAVYAATRAAKVNPLPYLFVCAFIANAASFVLPISNPANLVIFGEHMPPLLEWLAMFSLPSLAAIGMTYLVLRLTQRRHLQQRLELIEELPHLSMGARLTAAGLGVTAVVLLTVSALDEALGLPTFLAAFATLALVHLYKRSNPWPVCKGVAWGVLPLVAGLFVLVEGIGQTGVTAHLASWLEQAAKQAPEQAHWWAGILVAIACNIGNNLPVGLLSGSINELGHLPPNVTGALVVGVDLGPNLSVTGSLATLLWLIAVRREGVQISAWTFLKLGAVVMPPALIAALWLL